MINTIIDIQSLNPVRQPQPIWRGAGFTPSCRRTDHTLGQNVATLLYTLYRTHNVNLMYGRLCIQAQVPKVILTISRPIRVRQFIAVFIYRNKNQVLMTFVMTKLL